jgi:hypothetical protein
VVLSLSNAAVDRARQRHPKTKVNTKSFRQRFLSDRACRERLPALIFAQNPAVLDRRTNAATRHAQPVSK